MRIITEKDGHTKTFKGINQAIVYHNAADDEIVLTADKLVVKPMKTGEYDVTAYFEHIQVASMIFQADNQSYYYDDNKIRFKECEIVLYEGAK